MNVGQGDCTVIQVGHSAILVDDGPFVHGFDAGERIVKPKLRELGVTDISLVLLTHPDADHVGGTRAIHEQFPNARIAFSRCFEHRHEVDRELTTWHLDDDKVWWLGQHERLKVGKITLDVACPQVPPDAPTNDGSIFVRISDGAAAVVITGDAPIQSEQRIAPTGDWSADVLHVGHHGSKTSTSDAWLDAVHPTYGIISCGRNNEYGHPHRVVLDRLAAHHVTPVRTDQIGDIRFVVRGQHFVPDR